MNGVPVNTVVWRTSRGFFWLWLPRKWCPVVAGVDVGRCTGWFAVVGVVTVSSPEKMTELLELRGGWRWWRGGIWVVERWPQLADREGEEGERDFGSTDFLREKGKLREKKCSWGRVKETRHERDEDSKFYVKFPLYFICFFMFFFLSTVCSSSFFSSPMAAVTNVFIGEKTCIVCCVVMYCRGAKDWGVESRWTCKFDGMRVKVWFGP